jgi:hypothetical protein
MNDDYKIHNALDELKKSVEVMEEAMKMDLPAQQMAAKALWADAEWLLRLLREKGS